MLVSNLGAAVAASRREPSQRDRLEIAVHTAIHERHVRLATVTNLAGHFHLSRSTMANIVERLETRGKIRYAGTSGLSPFYVSRCEP